MIYRKDECFSFLGIAPTTKPVLLFFGGLRYEKGIDILFSALKHVRQEYILVIAGGKDYFGEEEVSAFALSNGVSQNSVVLRIGHVPEECLQYYFSLADVVVLPYRKSFLGQSGPLAEGIAHNCLVVGPDIGQIKRTLLDEEQGLVFECENALDLARCLSEAIDRLKQYGRATSLTESARDSLPRFMAEYRKTLSVL